MPPRPSSNHSQTSTNNSNTAQSAIPQSQQPPSINHLNNHLNTSGGHINNASIGHHDPSVTPPARPPTAPGSVPPSGTAGGMAAQGSYQTAPPQPPHMHGYKMGPSSGPGAGPQNMPPYSPQSQQQQQYSQGNWNGIRYHSLAHLLHAPFSFD